MRRLSFLCLAMALITLSPQHAHADYLFSTNFSSSVGTYVGNGPGIIDGELRITSNDGGQNGTWFLSPTEALNNFEFRCSLFIGGGSVTGADGFSFSYSELDGSVLGDFGDSTPGLAVRLVTWQTNQLIVEYNSATIATIQLDQPTIRQADFVPFEVTVINNNLVVRYNNTSYVNQAINGWAPQANWQIGLGARTGGSNDFHIVDDLALRSSRPRTIGFTRVQPQFIGPSVNPLPWRVQYNEAIFNTPFTYNFSNFVGAIGFSGPPNITLVLNQSFSFDSTMAPGTVPGGSSAVIANNRLQLTSATNGQTGSWHWQPSEAAQAFRATFDLRIGGGNGADGFCFAYAQNAQNNFGAYGPGGPGLEVEFDTYENGGEGTPVIRVMYNEIEVARARKFLRTDTLVPVEISVTTDGWCSVYHGGSQIAHVLLPSWNPGADWKFGLGAATGGLNDFHEVDNLSIVGSTYLVERWVNALVGPQIEPNIAMPTNVFLTDARGRGWQNISYPTEGYIIDNLRPSVVFTSLAPAIVNAPITVTASVNETSDFGLADLTPAGGTISNFASVGANTWTFTLTPAGTLGTMSVQVNENVFSDTVGNLNTASSVFSRDYDLVPPTITLSSTAPLTVNAPVSVTAIVSEADTDFDINALSPSNATVSDLTTAGVNTWTFMLTPTAQGNFGVAVNPGAFSDAAGNANTESASITRIFDSISPTIQSRVPTSGATVSALPNVQVRFTESVSNVTANQLEVNGSAATAVVYDDPFYVFSGFVPGGDGVKTVEVLGGAIADTAGNTFAGATWNVTVDSVAPTVALSAAELEDGDFVNSPAAFTFTATFSDGVSGFNATDVMVTNAASPVGNFTPVSASIYTFTVSPVADGPVTVEIPAAAANGIAAPNNATTASGVFTFTYDTTPPVLILAGDAVEAKACGVAYSDAGVASATDAIDGDLSGAIVISGDVVDAFAAPQPAPYVIVYSATDRAGNMTQVTREVTVSEPCPLQVDAEGESSREVELGETVALTVLASGAVGSLNYQWQKDDGTKAFQSLGAPNSPTLTLADFGPEDAGQYQCVVSDAVTVVTSPVFTLTMAAVPLPLGSLAALAALAGALALTGAAATRRKR